MVIQRKRDSQYVKGQQVQVTPPVEKDGKVIAAKVEIKVMGFTSKLDEALKMDYAECSIYIATHFADSVDDYTTKPDELVS